MGKQGGAVHVVRVRKSHVDKGGVRRDYQSAYLRRTFREGGKVRNETVANLSALPAHVVDWVEAGLKGKSLVPADQAATITASVPHGHVAAVSAQADALGLPTLLGPSGRQRDLAMALIISRVVQPASKLATASWWDDTTLGVDHDVAGASTDEVYACMDWLVDRQEAIEAKLAQRHLAGPANPSRMALFDLSSSWMEGRHCPLAKRGYSRDGKKGTLQIEYGLLTDPAGRPVAIKVFPGNTADPTAFTHAVATVRGEFTLAQLVMVGDRGMIADARIAALRADPDSDLGWLTAPSAQRRGGDAACLVRPVAPRELSRYRHGRDRRRDHRAGRGDRARLPVRFILEHDNPPLAHALPDEAGMTTRPALIMLGLCTTVWCLRHFISRARSSLRSHSRSSSSPSYGRCNAPCRPECPRLWRCSRRSS